MTIHLLLAASYRQERATTFLACPGGASSWLLCEARGWPGQTVQERIQQASSSDLQAGQGPQGDRPDSTACGDADGTRSLDGRERGFDGSPKQCRCTGNVDTIHSVAVEEMFTSPEGSSGSLTNELCTPSEAHVPTLPRCSSNVSCNKTGAMGDSAPKGLAVAQGADPL